MATRRGLTRRYAALGDGSILVPMQSSTIVVLVVDGLRAQALGAFGNTWYQTPSLDRLASEGMVYDRFLGESNQLSDAYGAMWTGQHVLDGPRDGGRHLLDLLDNAGYLRHLVTDEPELVNRLDTNQFDDVTFVDSNQPRRASEVIDTALGQVLEAAADVLGGWSGEYEQPRFLWVHLRGLLAAWDAPIEFARSLVDDDDPTLGDSLKVPEQPVVDSDEASDEVFLTGCRYAGQVMALDQSIGAIDSLLSDLWPNTPATVVCCGVRGFALGEHGHLGLGSPAYRELFHLPLIIRGPLVPCLVRRKELLQWSDISELLIALAGDKTPRTTARNIAAGRVDGSRYVETDEWQYVTREDKQLGGELYVAPDDLWQANDVASICNADAKYLEQVSLEIDRLAAAGRPWRQLATLSSGE